MATERKKGDKGVARTELVAVRFDPRTKFLLDVAARIQRRSIANYVEWAVDESLKSVMLEAHDGTEPRSVQSAGNSLWDVRESERVRKMAKTYPHLLTFDEQTILELTEALVSSYPLEMRDEPELFDELWRAHKGSFGGDAARTTKELLRELQDQGLSKEHIDRRIEDLERRISRLNEVKKTAYVIADTIIKTGGTRGEEELRQEAKRAGEEIGRRVKEELAQEKKKKGK